MSENKAGCARPTGAIVGETTVQEKEEDISKGDKNVNRKSWNNSPRF